MFELFFVKKFLIHAIYLYYVENNKIIQLSLCTYFEHDQVYFSIILCFNVWFLIFVYLSYIDFFGWPLRNVFSSKREKVMQSTHILFQEGLDIISYLIVEKKTYILTNFYAMCLQAKVVNILHIQHSTNFHLEMLKWSSIVVSLVKWGLHNG